MSITVSSTLESVVAQIISKYCNKMCNDIRGDWAKYSDIKGNAEINFNITSQTVGQVLGQFRVKGQKAWICEFGSGSSMQTADNFFAKYRNSKYWNPLRRGKNIVGRPAGSWIDLDDKEHTTKGTKAGQDMENIFKPKQPRNVIRRIIFDKNSYYWIGMVTEIRDAVKSHVSMQVLGGGGRLPIRV